MNDREENLIIAFTKMVNVTNIDQLPGVIDTVCNIFSNTLGMAIFRKLDENCDCPDCRERTVEILEGIINSTHEAAQMMINANMEAVGKDIVFGSTNHNANLAKEIQREIEAENKG